MLIGHLRPALVLLVLLTVLTGLAYPLGLTVAARVAMPERAGGSLVVHNGAVVGSSLIGQSFAQPRYFHGRPSAVGYDATISGGTNLGPSAKALADQVARAVASVRIDNSMVNAVIPVDLVTASGSGLDPDISLAAAHLQVPRVARLRSLPEPMIHDLIQRLSDGRQLFVLGEARVNVLALNIALDDLRP